jgi:arsenate reductase
VTCPVFFGDHLKLHWSTPDPAHVQGSEKIVQAAFDEAFGMLKRRIEDELF